MAAGSVAVVGLFATGTIPQGVQCSVRNDTPGDQGAVAVLNVNNPSTVLTGPGTFNVIRPDISEYGVSVGAYSDA